MRPSLGGLDLKPSQQQVKLGENKQDRIGANYGRKIGFDDDDDDLDALEDQILQ